MRNPVSPSGVTDFTSTDPIRARGGASGSSERDLDQHTFAVVQHEAREPVPSREPVDERSKADALNDPANPDPVAFHVLILR